MLQYQVMEAKPLHLVTKFLEDVGVYNFGT